MEEQVGQSHLMVALQHISIHIIIQEEALCAHKEGGEGGREGGREGGIILCDYVTHT